MELSGFFNELGYLVAAYRKNRQHFITLSFDESSLRNDFLTPFWRALGWDVENKKGLTQLLREVQVESRIDEQGSKKRADYLFRTDGIDRFVCEAKKPSVDLKRYAYQAQRYAFNLRLLLTTLSNFDSLQLFIVGGKPDPLAPWASYKVWRFDEYLDNVEAIWELFARDNVASGSLDRWIASLPKKEIRGKARQGWLIPPERIRTVDSEFLDYFETKRELLAKIVVKFNTQVKWNSELLSESVQRILDRVLFIRICEDRDIDTGPTLFSVVEDYKNNDLPKTPLYKLLVAHFNRLDTTFNGALFRAGHPSETFHVPDGFLIDLITELSNEDSPYLFSTLPVEILGNVYERFIGRVIQLDARGVPSPVDKPSVRKSGGVFYTPKYVVDFTIEEALRPTIDGKPPKQLSRLKIIDPSCGSGSFLIRVFERLCLEHLKWFIAHPKECNKENCYSDADGNLQLSTHYKRQIMLDNIFGVDIDGQAVEVTMLSLYLKILEGENRTTLGAQRVLFPKETFLPDLRGNIKCGNSLIARDFNRKDDSPEEIGSVNAFDWTDEFGAGEALFDAVVGNPPWGAEFDDRQRKYLAKVHSRVVSRMIDSYIYFIDRASVLLKSNGALGFVIPSTILNQVDTQPVRRLLLKRGVTNLTSLGSGVFGPKVLNTTTVVISRPQPRDGTITLNDLKAVPLGERKNKLTDGWAVPWHNWLKEVNADPYDSFLINPRATSDLFERLRTRCAHLSDVIDGAIQRGVSPDVVSANVLTPAESKEHKIERDLLRPSISGSQIKRYHSYVVDQRIIYTDDDTRINKFPNAKKYILAERKKYRQKFPDREECIEVRTDKHPWWRLHRPRNSAIFASPKIIGLTTVKTIELVFDEGDNLVVTDAMYVFKTKPDVSPWAVMAIMQSKVFLFLYRTANQGESRVIPQVKAAKLYELPFPKASAIASSPLADLAKQLTTLNDSLNEDISEKVKSARSRECASLQRKIEDEVKTLYRITDGDSKIIDVGAQPTSPN